MPAQLAQTGAVQMCDIVAVKKNAAVGAVQKMQDGAAQRRFAAAGLADNAQRGLLLKVTGLLLRVRPCSHLLPVVVAPDKVAGFDLNGRRAL